MTDKKLSNDRCKAKRPLNKKTVKGAMANKGRMVRRLKGPTRVVAFTDVYGRVPV